MPDAPVAQEPAKRTKAPASYHVLQLVDDAWKHLTGKTAVKASNRKEAIRKATVKLEEKAGTFVAVKESEWAPIPRKVEQKLEDVWG